MIDGRHTLWQQRVFPCPVASQSDARERELTCDSGHPTHRSVTALQHAHRKPAAIPFGTDSAYPEPARALLHGCPRDPALPAGGARAIDVALRYRQAELVVALRVKLPASRLTETLRAVEKDLRDRVVAGTEHVPLATLERFFG